MPGADLTEDLPAGVAEQVDVELPSGGDGLSEVLGPFHAPPSLYRWPMQSVALDSTEEHGP